jgi:hypothetical protein
VQARGHSSDPQGHLRSRVRGHRASSTVRLAEEAWRHRLSAACAAHAWLGRASLVLYDVSPLYFETTSATGFMSQGSPRSAWSR